MTYSQSGPNALDIVTIVRTPEKIDVTGTEVNPIHIGRAEVYGGRPIFRGYCCGVQLRNNLWYLTHINEAAQLSLGGQSPIIIRCKCQIIVITYGIVPDELCS